MNMLIAELLIVCVTQIFGGGEKRDESRCNSGEESDVAVRHLSGLLNHTAEFSVFPNLSQSVADVVWFFETHETTLKLVEFNQDLTIHSPTFGSRLQASDDGNTLRIRELRMEDGGMYSVRVTLPDHVICQYYYHLTVYAPVSISNITYSAGDSGENVLTVMFTGEQPVTVTWSKDGGDLPRGHRLSHDNKTLHIPKHATGLYRVAVTNIASTDSATYHIPAPGRFVSFLMVVMTLFVFLSADVVLCLLVSLWIRIRNTEGDTVVREGVRDGYNLLEIES